MIICFKWEPAEEHESYRDGGGIFGCSRFEFTVLVLYRGIDILKSTCLQIYGIRGLNFYQDSDVCNPARGNLLNATVYGGSLSTRTVMSVFLLITIYGTHLKHSPRVYTLSSSNLRSRARAGSTALEKIDIKRIIIGDFEDIKLINNDNKQTSNLVALCRPYAADDSRMVEAVLKAVVAER